MKNFLLLFVSLFLSLSAHADDFAPLDAKYSNLKKPRVTRRLSGRDGPILNAKASDVLDVISYQSSVKSQQSRGTCSIFSAAALLESLLIKDRIERQNVDLSEEWLQYLVSQTTTSEGSNSSSNFSLLKEHGLPYERTMPYIGEKWEDARSGEARRRCGHLENRMLTQCLVAHRDPQLLQLDDSTLLSPASREHYDPEFVDARREAANNKRKFFRGADSRPFGYYVGSDREIKALLDRGIPLTLDIDFFYGAWNHGAAEGLGIGKNPSYWSQGLVTYPEKDSMDRLKSPEKPAGHSIVVVGYDDSIEVEYTVKMKNSRERTFKRRGVYIIKNSWGTDSFGVNFQYKGNNLPGYGMILQDYAHEYGQFFKLDLR
ncbi:MAG: C1 family peptidase [Oligoflexia bacterium]|nr:C1 family peptidase [Oligoflexia bacterium]